MSKTEVKKKVSRIKSTKKGWYRIITPKTFANKDIGETYLSSPDLAIGRTLKANLRDITGIIKDQNAYVSFEIVSVTGSNLETKITGYELTSSYVKRMVRKNCDRIDDYHAVITKDGLKLIIKTFLLTANRTRRSVRSRLREMLQKGLREEASKSDFEQLILSVTGGKVQYPLKKKLSKIYPLKECAIRVLRVKGVGIPEIVPEEDIAESPGLSSEENAAGQI